LAYRSSKRNYWNDFSGGLFFPRSTNDTDLLRGNSSKTEEIGSPEDYLGKVKRKLEEIHEGVKKLIDIKSLQKSEKGGEGRCDLKARQIYFEEGQKMCLYNSQRKKGRISKLQSNWEGPYFVVKKLSDVAVSTNRTSIKIKLFIRNNWHLI